MNFKEKGRFADRLIQLRENKGETQNELASNIGVSRNTIVNYETGRTMPNAEILQLYMEHFEKPYSYIIDGEEVDGGDLYSKFKSLSPKEKGIVLTLIDGLKGLR